MSWTRVSATPKEDIVKKISWYEEWRKQKELKIADVNSMKKKKYIPKYEPGEKERITNSLKGVGTPIKDKLTAQIGREPTKQELKMYIRLVVHPTVDYSLKKSQTTRLINLINKNNEEKQKEGLRRICTTYKLHIS